MNGCTIGDIEVAVGERDDFMLGRQFPREMVADESRGAGDKDFHKA